MTWYDYGKMRGAADTFNKLKKIDELKEIKSKEMKDEIRKAGAERVSRDASRELATILEERAVGYQLGAQGGEACREEDGD